MATPVLNNGLFYNQAEYKIGPHIDSYHLRHQLQDTKPDDMGPIQLWAMLKKVDTPLYSWASLNSKDVERVQDTKGRWSWDIPVPNDLPSVVEDMDSSNTTKGIDGQNFQIKLSKRAFGKGDIITYDKYSGVELYIVPSADIIDAGEHAIYTVQLVNNDNVQYLSNAYLTSNTKYFRIGSARGEYGQEFSEVRAQSGFRTFYNYLSTAEAHSHYSVSSRADLMLRGGITAKGTLPVTEIWRNFDLNVDISAPDIHTFAKLMGGDYVKKAMANGTLTRTFLTNMEAANMTKVAVDLETYCMWGKGGRIKQDGPDDIRLTAGAWKQMDAGYVTVFNKNSFSLKLLETVLYNYYTGKVDLKGPDPERVLEVQLGMGMMRIINTLIKSEASGLGWIVNMDKSGANIITGEGMNLGFGYAFTSLIIPFFAKLVFRVNPALDPVDANSLENPMVDGFPLSSYSMIIQDYNAAKDNIKIKQWSWDPGFKWWYKNGTMDYMGRTSGFQSSDNSNGYSVFMSQQYPGIWVVDPTKILKLVMRNPVTGSHV